MRKNYRLFIGCNVVNGNDWNVGDAVNIIISICQSKGIAALSISECQGVYTYTTGGTVFENTVVLTLIDTSVNIKELTLCIKSALKQECIMVQEISDKFSFI